MAEKAELVVIGGGPGGYAAAFQAADLGINTILIDPEKNPGGVCLYRGCIPSKALLHLVKLKKNARQAEEFGVKFDDPKIDLKKIREWKDGVVTQLTGGLGQLSKQRKVKHIRGTASFKDSHRLIINNGKDESEIEFKHAIIATGSKPASLPGIDLEDDRIMYSARGLDLEDIPNKLLIVGAGYIGLEMATIYQGLGSKVFLAEMTDELMPGADRDLVKVFEKSNQDLFEEKFLSTKVSDIKAQKKQLAVTLENKDGKSEEKKFDKVLIAIGRKPNTLKIGLEAAGVELNDKKIIQVNAQRQTSQSHIFAIGDVAGEPMLAHKASHEGRIAAEVIAGKKSAYEPYAIPAVVFTDPELAWAGLTEMEAKEQNVNYKVAKFPWAASGRALTLGKKAGITKLILEKDTERILGIGIAGVHAGDMIPEGVLAIEMGAVARDLSLTIHPHPTLSETIMEAAESFYGSATHFFKKQKK